MQVAEAADRGGRLGDVLAACAECLTLLGDLRMLAAAVPMAAIPVRPRDYRLSAADAAFATVFGMVRSDPPVIEIEAITDDDGRLVMPQFCDDLLSTIGLEPEMVP